MIWCMIWYELHVPGTILVQQYWTLLVPRSYSYKEIGDAVTIEPPPPSPSTCRLCARSSRTPFRPQARGDGTRMPSVLGESRASCRLSSWARSNSGLQQQQYSSSTSIPVCELPARRRRQLLTIWLTSTASSLSDAVARLPGWGPTEYGFVRDRFSVYAAAELVCRRWVINSCGYGCCAARVV